MPNFASVEEYADHLEEKIKSLYEELDAAWHPKHVTVVVAIAFVVGLIVGWVL